jgi:hypothetical protein
MKEKLRQFGTDILEMALEAIRVIAFILLAYAVGWVAKQIIAVPLWPSLGDRILEITTLIASILGALSFLKSILLQFYKRTKQEWKGERNETSKNPPTKAD